MGLVSLGTRWYRMLNEPYEPGTQVIIWGRPETGLILLFGEGIYEGTTFVNGNYWPTVRLTDGREITVHQQGVSIGRADAVAQTCKRFSGDVIEWSLEAFLRGEKPSPTQRTIRTVTSTGGVDLPPPKTASDKVLFLKREIELAEKKKQLGQQIIDESNKVIAAKQEEIRQLSMSVIQEIAAVNPDIMKILAEQVAANLAAKKPEEQTTSESVTAAPAPVVSPIIVEDHHKLATED